MTLEIQQAFATLYSQVTLLAHKNQQVVGEKSDYYVTLQQLESLMLWAVEREQRAEKGKP
jgi:hypothetical protein